jgi:thioesterase domain-containing protein/acyl carrier protein
VLAAASIAFDASVFEVFAPLSFGGTVILAENILALETLPAREEVTLIDTVPSAMAVLLRQGAVPASTQRLACGGEFLSSELVDEICELGFHGVFDYYGPTEATVQATMAIRRKGGPVTIGKPIANTQVYILNAHLQPTPMGVAGELFIGGHGLARGYINRPELTAEKFIANPFTDEPGQRLYRTGDLCRYLPDGNIVYMGRMDEQVKLRGFRIELDEIASVLQQHEVVEEAVVLLREETGEEKRLVAYVVVGDATGGHNELKDFLHQRLPAYMVPSDLLFLDAIPRMPNDKVDRNALPVPDPHQHASETDQPYVPQTEIEQGLHRIWTEMLHVDKLGLDSNFFELGGHSLLAVELITRIREELQLDIAIRDLFERPTMGGLLEVSAVAHISATKEKNLSDDTCIEALRVGTWKRPLFCATGAGSVTGYYAALVSHLSPEQPFYGLKDPSLDKEAVSNLTVEALAERFIDAVRSIQPHGPYRLGGWSFGGIVAFEMAHQLLADGEEVDVLIILDSDLPNRQKGVAPSPLRKAIRLGGKCFRKLVLLCRAWPLILGYLRDGLGVLMKRIRRETPTGEEQIPLMEYLVWAWHDLHQQSSLREAGLSTHRFRDRRLTIIEDHFVRHVFGTMNSKNDALAAYEYKVYPNDIILIRNNFSEEDRRPALGWEAVVQGKVEIHQIAGPHEALLKEPYVIDMAKVLQSCLDRSQPET